MRQIKLLFGVAIIVTVGLVAGILGVFELPTPVPSTVTMKSKTSEVITIEEKLKLPGLALEDTSQATLPSTARIAGSDIVKTKKRPTLLIDDQIAPVSKVSPDTIIERNSGKKASWSAASMRETNGQPSDIEGIPKQKKPLWRLNAVIMPEIPDGPQVAVVIDDAGVDRRRTREVIALPSPLTIAFLTYADRLDEQVKLAVSAGHEIMTHVPMQPINIGANPGKNALNIHLKPAEIKSRLVWALTRIPGHVGINNHMGKCYTSHEKGMHLSQQNFEKLRQPDLVSAALSGPPCR